MSNRTCTCSLHCVFELSDAQLDELVSLLQLSDSAFPTGRYIHSYGLETYAQDGLLNSPNRASMLLDLLSDSIRLGVAPSDGTALACSHRAIGLEPQVGLELIVKADSRLTAVKLASEARDASKRMGRALLHEAVTTFAGRAISSYAELVEAGRSPGNHAVVFGVLTATLGVPTVAAITSELYAFSASWVAAAVRLSLTDHHTAQILLHRVRSVIADAALNAASRDVRHISSCTPLLDVMAMRHEQADLRLFAS